MDSRRAVPAIGEAVADIVDANPEREQRVGAGPRRRSWLLASDGQELGLDLFNHRDNSGLVRSDEVGVDSGATVCVIVR